ncbi:stealth family protein [Peterkaempfera bronchialis]|uniref:stealth family protein n=1 Tax=Peterkaempfera bronchialis TaxID=2126346 RepID=UPI001E42BE0A|nr:stealth family protein [Peterkaempfera bronchialis]
MKQKASEQLWTLRAARSRRKAAAAHGGLQPVVTRQSQKLYGRVVDHFRAAEAAAGNLDLAIAACERAGVEYFRVPAISRTRHVLGVRAADRARLIRALTELNAGKAVYIGQPLGGDRLLKPALFLDGKLPRALMSAPVLRLGENHLGPQGQLLAGPELGCDIEFWQDGDTLLDRPEGARKLAGIQPQASEAVFREAIVAPRQNRIADVVAASEQQPATVKIGDREVPTFEVFSRPTLADVTFPVDVVYTWVDGEEPAMRAKRARYKGEGTAEILDKEINESRYTNHDELKYSLRSLEMYADFIRHIYIVTDGQRPHWLKDDAEGVTVVDHRDIFPADVLPVFNSHAIETRLHHIPGLSDHYLYFNDDVFVGRRVTAEHFFLGSGTMRVPVSPLKIGVGKPHAEETATNSANKNVRELLFKKFGRMTTNNFMHTPLPQQRLTLQELAEMFPEEVAQTTASRFRSPQDIAMTAPLLYQYALATGKGVQSKYRFRYVNIGREDADKRLADLQRSRRFDFFCLNDVDVPPEQREEVSRRMHDFLEQYFPFPSSFEKSH